MCNALKPTGCETARRLAAAEERVKRLEEALKGAEAVAITAASELQGSKLDLRHKRAFLSLRTISMNARAALQEAPRDAS